MPKLPKSSFQYYITKKVAKIKEKNPDVNGWTIRTQLTEKWAQMSPEDKVSVEPDDTPLMKQGLSAGCCTNGKWFFHTS